MFYQHPYFKRILAGGIVGIPITLKLHDGFEYRKVKNQYLEIADSLGNQPMPSTFAKTKHFMFVSSIENEDSKSKITDHFRKHFIEFIARAGFDHSWQFIPVTSDSQGKQFVEFLLKAKYKNNGNNSLEMSATQSESESENSIKYEFSNYFRQGDKIVVLDEELFSKIQEILSDESTSMFNYDSIKKDFIPCNGTLPILNSFPKRVLQV